MELRDFELDFLAATQVRAYEQSEFQSIAFVEEAAERLITAEELADIDLVQYQGTGRKGRRLQIDGYSWEPATGFLTILVADFSPEEEVREPLTLTEAKKFFRSCQGFFLDSASGSLSETIEASAPAFGIAGFIRETRDEIEKIRILLVSNRRMSDRIKSIPPETEDGFTFTFNIWDTQRFFLAQVSGTGREALEVDLREWNPQGLEVLRGFSTQEGTTSYLAAIPAVVLAQVYEKFGSRLLEANVRSFLSTRGKVNSGIRQTLRQAKDMFFAYNNGITTTAESVEIEEKDGSLFIQKIVDWQIVNGGQTTASISNFLRTEPEANLEEVFVQMKLVVVSNEESSEIIQSIARFANSQNPVNEADFFANSPFHRQIETLSSRLLAPARGDQQFQTRWFYERARGQYVNEKTKRSGAELRKFELSHPRSQVITKTDLAKYFNSWNQLPHVVSQGAQANFLKFARNASAMWESNREEVNENYFKSLVAKAILFQQIRSNVMRQDWYENGYLANIVTYTVARISQAVSENFSALDLDFGRIWRDQDVPEDLIEFGMLTAEDVLNSLTAEDRRVVNVTQWAKQEACWQSIKKIPFARLDLLSNCLIDKAEARVSKAESKKLQTIDDSIKNQTIVVRQNKRNWEKISSDDQILQQLSPTDLDLIQLISRPGWVPSELQAARLIKVLEIAWANGTIRRDKEAQ